MSTLGQIITYGLIAALVVLVGLLLKRYFTSTAPTSSTWFIAADDKNAWFAANPLQVKAIEKWNSSDDVGPKVDVDSDNFFNIKRIGNEGQSDRRYAIQDRSAPYRYRQFKSLGAGLIE